MAIILPFVRRPVRRPLEDVRRRVVGGYDDFDPWFDDGLTPADRVALAREQSVQVISFPHNDKPRRV